MTEALFTSDPYTRSCEARVVSINDRGGLILDRTVFYAAGGGQPGDAGRIETAHGQIEIATTVYDEDRSVIAHVPSTEVSGIEPGADVTCTLDWSKRYAHMRVHTALHLLCALVPYPVTGGQIQAHGGRLDFDIPDAGLFEKAELTEQLQALIANNHAVTARWISYHELAANPALVRTMAVQPPTGSGQVRLIEIGGGEIDQQPCGGTHVANTGEIGDITVSKIEKKGARNRRIRLALAGQDGA